MPKTETLAKTSSVDTLALRSKPGKDLSYGDIAKALVDAGDIVSVSEYGTGFSVLDNKEKGRLVGVPFIILDWNINEGDFGPFVSLQVITQAGERLIINDGSSGVLKQIEGMVEAGERRAVHVKKGLRRSDFEYTDKDGSKKPATTFYLDTSG